MHMIDSVQESTPYWLFAWLESRKVRTSAEAAILLSKRSTLHELRDVAEQWSESVEAPPQGVNLVAGTGLRLDDDLLCPNPACRRSYVDVLFRHAWHYFDRILLPDGVGDLLLNPPVEWSEEYAIERILGMIEVVLHMQHLGAESLVSYYPPIKSSPTVLDSILFGKKESRWYEAWLDVESALVEEGEIKIERVGKRKFQVRGSDPFLDLHQTLQFELQKGQKQSELPALFAHERLHSHIFELEEDLVAAQQLKGTLGSSVGSHERVLSRLSTGVDATNVLFQIAFPSLEQVPIKELISLRLHEGDAFLAFRQALTKAAQEMIANNQCADPKAMAAKILRDVVDPELAKLRQRLHSAQNTLARKTVISLAIAGVSTLCGLQFGLNPVAVGAAGLIMSGVGSAAANYADEKQEIEMSDMFFLWKALQHVE